MDLYFPDLNIAITKQVEARLWAAHGRVNAKFRSYLATLREAAAKKKYVERRKAEALYLTFLKSSIKFYRGFIQRLAANFKNVPEILKIAHAFGLESASAHPRIEPDLDQKGALLRSCHDTLIRLGDLSRYRETEIPKDAKQRNWAPALGYYDLAGALLPTDGQAFNQKAVISLTINDHLRSVYYLYRALTVAQPHPNAEANLEVELKKIIRRQAKGETLLVDIELEQAFLTFHARCLLDENFQNYKDHGLQLASDFGDALHSKPYDPSFRKMVLINMAASEHAWVSASKIVAKDPKLAIRRIQSYQKLQDFNIDFFIVLLRMLHLELKSLAQVQADKVEGSDSIHSMTPPARKILPLVRLYSSWLLSKAEKLLEAQQTQNFHPHLSMLWQGYAATTSRLVEVFQIQDLPEVNYLLDEDYDTAAFLVWSEKAKERRLFDVTGNMKPSRSEAGPGTVLPPDMEMLARVRDLVTDSVYFKKKKVGQD